MSILRKTNFGKKPRPNVVVPDIQALQLKAYYRFDSSLIDEINGYNGVGTGISYATGKSGDAVYFSSGSSTIRIDNPAFDIYGTTNFSLSCLVNQFTTPGPAAVNLMGFEQNGNPGTNDKCLRVFSDLSVDFYAYGGSEKSARSAPSIFTLNQWMHITGTYDGITLRLYINGILEASLSCPSTFNFTNPIFAFSRYGSGAAAVNGLIDGGAVYNKALSSEEAKLVSDYQMAGNELI